MSPLPNQPPVLRGAERPPSKLPRIETAPQRRSAPSSPTTDLSVHYLAAIEQSLHRVEKRLMSIHTVAILILLWLLLPLILAALLFVLTVTAAGAAAGAS